MKLKLPVDFRTLWLLAMLTGIAGFAVALFLSQAITGGIKQGFVGVCLAGVFIAILSHLNLLKIYAKCPDCGSYGTVTFGHQEGHSEARPLFDCNACGRLVNDSHIKVSIKKVDESVCPDCGYEYSKNETKCPHCEKKF